MIARYVSREADPFERGCAFGRDRAAAVGQAIAAYERLLTVTHPDADLDLESCGEAVGERLSRAAPALLGELEGIARGAAVELHMLLAINARTELLAGLVAPECSVVGLAPPRTGSGTLAQNWDWHPDLAPAVVLWTVHDADGGWFVTLTEAGMVGKLGVNSRGLGLCLNILGSSADGGLAGTPIHVLLRLVLERCGNLAEAEELLRAEPVSGSSCVTVASTGPDGTELAGFELSPVGVVRIDAVDGVFVHTNHFLAPPPGLVDTMRSAWPDTVDREAELRGRLAATRGPLGPRDLRDLLRSHRSSPISVCCHDPENPRYEYRQQTLASLVMEPGAGLLLLRDGNPCRGDYEAVPLPSRALAGPR